MKRHDRQLLRAAAALLTWLELRAADPMCVTPPRDDWQLLERRARQQQMAIKRGWWHAENQVTQMARREVERLRRQLGNLAQQLTTMPATPQLPTACDIYQDLLALKREFPAVIVDPVSCQLLVTTEPIILEGINLGAFEIQLCWNSHAAQPPYRVVMQAHKQVWGSDNITHPHVQNDELCEGEGAAAIEQALEAGRFYDFFLLVSRVLNTYAPGSAYLQLDETNHASCADCGDSVSDDDCSQCLCGESICDRCSLSCDRCKSTLCADCAAPCSLCQAQHCEFCLNHCTQCNSDHCQNCQGNGGCAQPNEEPSHEEKHKCQGASDSLAPQAA